MEFAACQARFIGLHQVISQRGFPVTQSGLAVLLRLYGKISSLARPAWKYVLETCVTILAVITLS